jgi:hypothetical protein
VSGGRLSGGHGGTAAYPGNGEDDGGVARSNKRGQKQSGSFGHGRAARLSGRGGGGQNTNMARLDSAFKAGPVRREGD